MAEKKAQHLVPACYLEAFIAKDISDLKKKNPNFEAGVYVSNNSLTSGWKMRGIHHKTFVKSYFYNVKSDDPNNPYVENFLCSIESQYKKNLNKIFERKITKEVLSFISYFMTLQMVRVPKFINHHQAAWDQIADHLIKMTGDIAFSELFEDLVKKTIPNIGVRESFYLNAHIIYNHTQLPFLTSDHPVIQKMVNVLDLKKVLPQLLVDVAKSQSYEVPFFFYPLSPWTAYISCELIKSSEIIEFNQDNLAHIFYLNYCSIMNAERHIYSSINQPTIDEEKMSKYIADIKLEKTTVIKIYTKTDRVISTGEIIENNYEEISLKLNNLHELLKLKREEFVSLVEVFYNNESIRRMIDCSIKDIDLPNKVVKVESNFRLGL